MKQQCVLLVFLSAFIVSPLQAQRKLSFFSTPFVMSTGVDNSPDVSGGTASESFVLIAPARPSFSLNTPTVGFNASYRPEFEFLPQERQVKGWNHFVDVSYGQLLNSLTTLDLTHSFSRSTDPVRLGTNNLFVHRRNTFREHLTAATLTRTMNRRTTLTFRFDNAFTRNGGADQALDAYLNLYGITGTVGAARQVGRNHKLSGFYSLLKFSPYKWDASMNSERFLSNVVLVRAGISRFAIGTGVAVSRAIPATLPEDATGELLKEPLNPEGVALPKRATANTLGNLPAATDTTAGTSSPSATVVTNPFESSTPVQAVALTTAIPTMDTGRGRDDDARRNRNRNNEPAPAVTLLAPTTPTTSTLVTAPAVTPASATPPSQPFQNALMEPFHVVGGVYTFRQGTGLQVEFSGALMRDRDNSYVFSTEVRRGFHRFWLGAGVQHFLSSFEKWMQLSAPATQPTGGLRPQSRFTAGTIRFGGSPTNRIDFEVSTSLSRSSANFVTHDLRSVIVGGRVNYWFTERVSIFAGLDSFHENRLETVATAFDRNRLSSGVQVHLSPAKRPPLEED